MSSYKFTTTGWQVVKAMHNYQPWRELPEQTRKLWQPYINHSPRILEPYLNQSVSTLLVFCTKLAWLDWLSNWEVIQKLSRRVDSKDDPVFFQHMSIFSLQAHPWAAIEKLDEYRRTFSMAVTAAKNPTPERRILQYLGVSEDLLVSYDRRELTIERLLLQQPGALLFI